jgi:hypothetical protein
MTVVPLMRKSTTSSTFVRCVECIEEIFTGRYERLTGEDQDAVRSRLPSIAAYLMRGHEPAQVLRLEGLSHSAVEWLMMSLSLISRTLLQEALADLDAAGGIRFGRFSLDGFEVETVIGSISALIDVSMAYYRQLGSATTVGPE